jgi:acyl-CoA reductase-like NAD-dependent aldehyde dehydrogenase
VQNNNQTAFTVVHNPATGEEITTVPSLDEAEVDQAIVRASAAFETW